MCCEWFPLSVSVHCVVKFHLDILCLVNFVYRALGRFYPRVISQVNAVSVDVMDIVAFSMVAYLDDFTEAVDSECLLSIKVPSVAEVTQL